MDSITHDLAVGANRPLNALDITISVEHGGRIGTSYAVAVLPLGGVDRPCIPMQNDIPSYAHDGTDQTHYQIDLAKLHSDTTQLLVVVHAGNGSTTLKDLGWVRANIADARIELRPDELAVGALVIAEIYRRNGEWKIRAKCDGVFAGLVELGRRFGMDIPAPVAPPVPAQRDTAPGSHGRRDARPAEWGGSGFTVADGCIITNAHVVRGAGGVLAIGPHGRFEAQCLLMDDENDLALIRIPHVGAEAPLRFRVEGPRLGETAITAGHPMTQVLGSGLKVNTGIVSGMTGPNDDIRAFQLSTPVQPGSSGGPVVDSDGLLIGVIVAQYAGMQNVNLAIRASMAAALMEAADVKPRYEPAMDLKSSRIDPVVATISKLTWRLECYS